VVTQRLIPSENASTDQVLHHGVKSIAVTAKGTGPESTWT